MRTTLFIIPALLTLAACSPAQTSISEQNKNPLTASRYGDELADTMANFVITEDPIAKDPEIRKIIDSEIERGKEIADEARQIQNKGWMGVIIQIKADVIGHVLYHGDTLYLSSNFETSPGAELHLYLTTVVDPRDAAFPDPTAVDLGIVQAAYGPQQYAVPPQEDEGKLRTFVLYDTRLQQIYGFAQLSKAS